MKKTNIIALSGKAGSGKDLVGKIIQYLSLDKDVFSMKNNDIIADLEHGAYCCGKSAWQIKKFGAPIKQIASIMTGIPVERMETQKDKEVVLGEEWSKSCSLDNCDACREESKCKVMFVDNKYNKLSMRRLLQRIEDQMLQIHPDWLLNVMFKDYRILHQVGYFQGPYKCKCRKCGVLFVGNKDSLRCEKCATVYPTWIITDLGKPNEYNKIKELGGKCIKVVKLPTIKEIPTNDKPGTGNTSFEVTMEAEWVEHISETALDHITDWDYIIEAEHGDIDSLIKQVKQILIKFGLL